MLTYQNYCDFHANKCTTCKGEKRIVLNGVWTACSCQYCAAMKWRFDQIQIYPDELKYKTWDDFVGVSGSIRLTKESFYDAKMKALQYCFNTTDLSKIRDRKQHLIIDRHLIDGQNVVISGSKQSGKSLLATLILKEVVYASAVRSAQIDFVWVKMNDIINAARWDTTDKSIDYELLDKIENTNFLFIDGVDVSPSVGNHRAAPDILSINKTFGSRLSMKLPTILICSEKIISSLDNPVLSNEVRIQCGDEFINLLTHHNNVNIYLKVSN